MPVRRVDPASISRSSVPMMVDGEDRLGMSVRKKGRLWEARVFLGHWAGPRLILGLHESDGDARRVLVALARRIVDEPKPWTSLTVWSVARTGLGLGGETATKLRSLLPVWVVARGDGWYTHRMEQGGRAWVSPQEAYRAAAAEWSRRYRAKVLKRVAAIRSQRPPLEWVAEVLNAMGMRFDLTGELWTEERLRDVLRKVKLYRPE